MSVENGALRNIARANEVFVCGGGHQGLSMAAHLALNGLNVSLWNRTAENIKEILDTGEIICNGIVNGVAKVAKVSSEISETISDFIMVATPSSAHKDVAKRLSPYVNKDTVIVLNPGRTFGAVEFAETLEENGVKEMPHIAETQTIVYTCRRNSKNGATIYALKNDVKIAALKSSDINYVMARMPECIYRYFKPVNSVAVTSLSNVGMVLHCAPVLMNIGWIETEKADFKYYYDGISKSVAGFLEKIDKERLLVARSLGYSVASTAEWMKDVYGVDGDNIYDCIRNNESYREIDAPPTIRCRYIMEDIPNGLVPIEHLAKCIDIETPAITTTIDMACQVLDIDFRSTGRKYSPEKLRMYL